MKFIRRAFIGLGMGILAFFIVYQLINMQDRSVNYRTESWQSPQLPVAYIQVEGQRTNPMQGHRRQQAPTLTDADLALLTEDGKVLFQVQTNGVKIGEVRFKIYDMTQAAKEIEYSRVAQTEEKQGILGFSVQPSQPLVQRQPYLLELELTQAEEEGKLYYYSRLEKLPSIVLNDYLTFVQRFFDSTMAGTELAQLSNQITYENKATATYCDMTTGETAILWGRKQPILLRRPIPRLIQAGDYGLSITQAFRVEHEGEQIEARELYRLNQQDEHVNLVHYEREMSGEVPSTENIVANRMELGLQEEQPMLEISRDRKALALVKGDRIWSYRLDEGEFNLIYGAAKEGSLPDRRSVRIQEVADDGSITFFVGGYMDSSLLEGHTGVAVYRYDHSTHVTKQLGFVDIPAAGALIAQQMERFAYLNANQEFFMVIEGNLYKADLKKQELFCMEQWEWKSMSEMSSGTGIRDFTVSASGRQFALCLGSDPNPKQLVELYDLESGKRRMIKAAEGERIKSGIFLGEDYVYGMAKEEDLATDKKGNSMLGCYCLEVQGIDGEVLSRYQKDNLYIGSWRAEGHVITLKGYTKVDDYFVETMEDHIINNAGKEENEISLKQHRDGRWYISLKSHLPETTVQVSVPVQMGRDLNAIPLELSQTQEGFLAFGRGQLLQRTASAGEAVRLAAAAHGRVEDENRQIIWQRGEVEPLGVVMEPSSLPIEEINTLVADHRRSALLPKGVLNLSGAKLDSLYQFLSRRQAVIGFNDWHEVVVLYGYDLQGLYVLKLTDGSTEQYSYEKAAQILGGNDRFWLVIGGK